MANLPQPKREIKRVPVPVRHPALAPISTVTSSPPVVLHTHPALSSSSPPSTQNHFTVRGQYRPRGPIPIVATNSEQPLPAQLVQRDRDYHYSQPSVPYPQYTINMDLESQNRQSTLPPELEEDIKAAVLASMPSQDPSAMRIRKTIPWRKGLRWTILSLCISLVIGEIPVSILFGTDISAIFAFVLGSLLALWNGYRLFRMRQKFDNEVISGWHIGLECTSILAIIAISTVVGIWGNNRVAQRQYYSDNAIEYTYGNVWEDYWRGLSVVIILAICGVLHFIVLILTAMEKWTKPAYMQVTASRGSQYQQPPQIIVQYTPTCPHCHGHEPRPNEDENSYLARIGDSQPQGVAPVTLAKHKEAMFTEETLNDYEYSRR
ncbi:hypothetical protein F5B22DRAFT_645748 [Xylaria bambusicola]|uniref:uncharacterized protein n=1 Tax=Xylaria bambusicola TaxID=326684 RepID=UPI0020086A58|nr:uncharacterized protein F5B22DRAFT_645748 [Xylaria bambusicola]KAI0517566.1 hypothetical protein F5B22DRAFT_645748 [Xylaria bambusicola]